MNRLRRLKLRLSFINEEGKSAVSLQEYEVRHKNKTSGLRLSYLHHEVEQDGRAGVQTKILDGGE